MQIPSCKFHYVGFLVQILSGGGFYCMGPSYEHHCAGFIVQLDHADFIVQILLCVFLHAHSVVSIERILSKAFLRANADFILRILSCGLHCADSIVRISLCKIHCLDSIVRILSCAFHHLHSIVCIPSCAFHHVHFVVCISSCALHMQ